MALSDVQIRSLKPADKLYKITDEKGLYLEVSPNGSKLWRYKYLYMGKNKRIALGRYPEVGLAEARRRRLEARENLDNRVDPLGQSQTRKADCGLPGSQHLWRHGQGIPRKDGRGPTG